MPRKALKPCKHPGCPRLTDGAYCDEHKPLHPGRPSAAKRGYGSKWQRVSKAHLRKHPLCVKCLAQGKFVTATVVDHIVPRRVGKQRLTALPQQVFTHPPSKPDLQLSLYPAFQLFLRLFSTVNFIMTFFTNYKSFSIHFRHHKNPIGYMLASFSVFLFYVF